MNLMIIFIITKEEIFKLNYLILNLVTIINLAKIYLKDILILKIIKLYFWNYLFIISVVKMLLTSSL